ncbi:hypothetical protein ACHAP5_010842 [Fusarium lateritium]
MTSPTLNQLPPEIILEISDKLTCNDIKALSRVNKNIRKLVVSRLFKHVKVECPLPREHVLHSVVGKYGTYVSRLRLQVTFFPNPPNSSYDGNIVNATYAKGKQYWNDYPPSVWARNTDDISAMRDLIQLKGLPNCTALSVFTDGERVSCTSGPWSENRSNLRVFVEPETYDQVRGAERKYAWRQAHAEMWRDIAGSSQVEQLELIHFLPLKSSSWLEPKWAQFLGGLKKLSVQAYGYVTGDLWQADSMEGFNAFYREMPISLFAHAKQLEHLEIASHWSAYLGSDTLRFAPNTLPRLKIFRLGDACITANLKEFLVEHSPNLKSLHFVGCSATAYPDPSPGRPSDPNWGDFWKAIRESIPVLREVTWKYPVFHQQAVDGIATEDESLIVWPYIKTEGPYGYIVDCPEVAQERLAAGDDNREYKLLMEELARRQQST